MTYQLFVISNSSLKEAYVGKTQLPFKECVSRLRKGLSPEIAHWKWKENQIDYDMFGKVQWEPLAKYRLHTIKRKFARRHVGWKVFSR
jgi:recombinational DNA repair protein (RecF pathway)